MIAAMYDRSWAPGRIWAICNLELHLACNQNAEMWGFMKLIKDEMSLLWLDFVLGLNLIFLCSKLIITPKQRKINIKTRIKLNQDITFEYPLKAQYLYGIERS